LTTQKIFDIIKLSEGNKKHPSKKPKAKEKEK